jgi:hypothetical protein
VIGYIPPKDEKPLILKCKNYIPELESYFNVSFYSDLLKKEKKQF